MDGPRHPDRRDAEDERHIFRHREAARRRSDRPAPVGPESFLVKHRKWLAEIAKKKKAVHAELEASLAAQGGAAAGRGKAVLVEKPLCTTIADCLEVGTLRTDERRFRPLRTSACSQPLFP